MKDKRLRFAFVLLGAGVLLLAAGGTQAQASDAGEWSTDKINVNLGASMSLPVKPDAPLVNNNPGVDIGVGYNFNQYHSIIGEFTWIGLAPSSHGLDPIRTALGDSGITGHSNLYAGTANYRFQWQSKVIGAYAIGGGGLYYRTSGFAYPVTTGSGIPCTRTWLWTGFKCSTGTVTANQTLQDFNSVTIGGNVGAGITAKLADPSYRFYVEWRYHYAPTANVSTEVQTITVGFRY